MISKIKSCNRTIMDKFSQKIRKCNDHNITNYQLCYIGTNEIISANLRKSEHNKKCHIGVSGWHNFDIIAQTYPNHAIIFDYNINQVKFMKWSIYYVNENVTRDKFLDHILSHIKSTVENQEREVQRKISQQPNGCIEQLTYQFSSNDIRFYPNLSLDPSYSLYHQNFFNQKNIPLFEAEIRFEMIRINSWLSNDQSYNYVRQMIKNDKIAILCLDARNLEPISRLLNENFFLVDTFYISNVADYMKTEKDKNKLIENVNMITSNETKIIWSISSKNLKQYITNKVAYILFNSK